MAPKAYFDNAPRFHSGLGGDEFATFLKQGDRVFTALNQSDTLSAAAKLGIGPQLNAIMTTPASGDLGAVLDGVKSTADLRTVGLLPAVLQEGERVISVDQQRAMLNLVARAQPSNQLQITVPLASDATQRFHNGLGGSDFVDNFRNDAMIPSSSGQAATSEDSGASGATTNHFSFNLPGIADKKTADTFMRSLPHVMRQALDASARAKARNG